jgi:hypothetical protein
MDLRLGFVEVRCEFTGKLLTFANIHLVYTLHALQKFELPVHAKATNLCVHYA